MTCSGTPLVKIKTREFDDWPVELEQHLTSAEAQRIRAFNRAYRSCFVFSLEDLKECKGKSIYIQLEDDHLIFGQP